ncbi:MAG: ABC transporter ATP-binding protein, partial [Chloroflexi bacterium]|nr:ABC transporter ATP-binding protein [Chloroflexota bacterium]
MKPLGKVLRYLRKHGLTTLGAYASLLLATGASLVSPRLLQLLIDRGISAGDMRTIIVMALTLVGVALVGALFTFLQGYLSEKASQSVAYDLRNALYAKIQSLSFSYHDRAQTGQLMTRATSDVEMVRRFTGMGFLQMLNAVVMLFGSLAVLFSMNWRLTLLILAIVPVSLLLFGVFGRRVRPMFTRVQQNLAALNTVLQENLAGTRVVKAFAREPHEAERFRRANQTLLNENLAVFRTLALLIPTIFLVANLGTAGIVWYGGLQVIGGQLTVGELVAFNSYLFMVMMPVGMLGMIFSMIAQASASAERIFEILEAESEVV